MRLTRLVFPALFLLTAPLGPAQVFGQQPVELELTRVADELAVLNRTMVQVAALLQENLKRSEVELLLKRLEMAQRAIAPREDQLAGARAELDALNEQETRFHAELSRVEEEARTAGQPGSHLSDADIQRQRDEMGLHLKLLNDRMRAVQQRIIDLENELAADRRDLAVWEEEIDRRLGLRK